MNTHNRWIIIDADECKALASGDITNEDYQYADTLKDAEVFSYESMKSVMAENDDPSKSLDKDFIYCKA